MTDYRILKTKQGRYQVVVPREDGCVSVVTEYATKRAASALIERRQNEEMLMGEVGS